MADKATTSKRTDTDIVGKSLNIFYEAQQGWKDAHESTAKAYEWVRGDEHWTAAEKETLDRSGRPYLTLNILLPVVTQMVGQLIQARKSVRLAPQEGGDVEVAEIITKIVKRIFNRSALHTETLPKVFADALIGDAGGYFRRIYSNAQDPYGEVRYERINPLYVFPDPLGEKPDGSDWRYVCLSWWASREDTMRDFPDKKADIERLVEPPGQGGFWGSVWSKLSGARDKLGGSHVNEKEGTIRIIHVEYKVPKVTKVVIDPTSGESFEAAGQDLNEILREYPEVVIADKSDFEYRVATIAGGNVVLQDVKADVQGGFSVTPLWAFDFDGKKFGIIKNGMDYQEYHNKLRSQVLHILNTTANSGWLLHEDSDVDIEMLEQEGSKTGVTIKWKGQPHQKPEKIQPNNIPAGHEQLDATLLDGAQRTMMSGENIRGLPEHAGESGKLYQERVQQGLVMQEPLFTNVTQALRLLALDALMCIQQKYTAERIMRVVGDDGNVDQLYLNWETAQGIANDVTIGKYDVEVADDETTPTARREKFVEMMTFFQGVPPDLVPYHLLVRASDFSDKDQIAQFMEQRMGVAAQAQGALPPGAVGDNIQESAEIVPG